MIRVSQEKKGLDMSPDGTYNGYANYQTWNVCLWISNDEGINELAAVCLGYGDFKSRLRELATDSILNRSWKYTNAIFYETPDGVSWNDSNINLAEMQEFWNENFSHVGA